MPALHCPPSGWDTRATAPPGRPIATRFLFRRTALIHAAPPPLVPGKVPGSWPGQEVGRGSSEAVLSRGATAGPACVHEVAQVWLWALGAPGGGSGWGKREGGRSAAQGALRGGSASRGPERPRAATAASTPRSHSVHLRTSPSSGAAAAASSSSYSASS